jgi:nicotinamide mononucleotide transporter
MNVLHILAMLSTLTLLNIAFVLLAIAGNEFIRRRDARGWRFWIPANILAVLYFGLLHEWWTLALFGYYLISSILGLVHWRRNEKQDRLNEILLQAFDAGFTVCATEWARRDDLLADIGSPAYLADRKRALG